ncbi:group II intron maturase-specific domain-containing protein [Sinorhizobium meliloti]|nr:group II intron maturase-specific domain-containing protein [Sinorhizobium meliloti]
MPSHDPLLPRTREGIRSRENSLPEPGSLNIPRQTPGTLAEIAKQLNPLLRGWIAYYGRYSRSALSTLADYVNQKLRAWIRRKFKRFQSHNTRASLFLRKLARENPGLFVHWKAFGTNTFT